MVYWDRVGGTYFFQKSERETTNTEHSVGGVCISCVNLRPVDIGSSMNVSGIVNPQCSQASGNY